VESKITYGGSLICDQMIPMAVLSTFPVAVLLVQLSKVQRWSSLCACITHMVKRTVLCMEQKTKNW